MLLRLLSLISTSKQLSTTAEMARHLGVGEGLLEKMLEDATRMGYLSALESDCMNARCSTCHSKATCQSGSTRRVWSLTEKGKRLVGRLE